MDVCYFFDEIGDNAYLVLYQHTQLIETVHR
jgi:hypothetical protein